MLLVEAHEPETERAESSSLLIVKPISYIYIFILLNGCLKTWC